MAEHTVPAHKPGVDRMMAEGRLHPSTAALWRYLSDVELPRADVVDDDRAEVHINYAFCELASEMIAYSFDGPEVATGLRKLLEARDCFIRAHWPVP